MQLHIHLSHLFLSSEGDHTRLPRPLGVAARATRAARAAWTLTAVEGAWALTAVEGVVETSRHGHVLTCSRLAQSEFCIGDRLLRNLQYAMKH